MCHRVLTEDIVSQAKTDNVISIYSLEENNGTDFFSNDSILMFSFPQPLILRRFTLY